jgi:hypothetical protein
MMVKTVTKWNSEYININNKIKDKKNLLQFLPKCLDEISKNKHFEYKGKRLKSAYPIDLVHYLILKYYFKKSNKFDLFSVVLKQRYGHEYNFYIDYLVDKKILILLSNHLKGKKSRTYALCDGVIKGSIKRYNNNDNSLVKKYKSKIVEVENDIYDGNLIDKDVKIKLVNDLFNVHVEFERSIFYLDSLKNEDVDIYNRNRYSVECIKDGHIFYHFDRYGRMHTNFTILKSFIRKNCLLINGEETCEIDIKNSQPLFLSKVIEEVGTKWVKEEEFNLFKYLTISGKYYKYLMNELNINDKSVVKELTYKVLFGKNSANSNSDKLFSRLFPTIHHFIKLYKRDNGDYRILAYRLQKAESNLIFNNIIREIMNIHPEASLVTIHDSIIMPNKYKESISAIFNSKLYEEFNIS